MELPGRGTRYREPAFTDFSKLIEVLKREIAPELKCPSLFFGHSLGALVAFELARALAPEAARRVEGVVVSSLLPPTPENLKARQKISPLPDAEFLLKISEYGALPNQLMPESEVRSLYLRILRNDICLMESIEEQPLIERPIPLLILGGERDLHVPEERLRDWSRLGFPLREVRTLPGDHFYINYGYEAALTLIFGFWDDRLSPKREKNMMEMNKPRQVGRVAVKDSVPAAQWAQNEKFADEIKEMIAKHRLSRHPVSGLLNTEKLNPQISLTLHLEFAHAFAQIFTDSLIEAMAAAKDLEGRLGPMGKVSARFLLQINLLDELGYKPAETVTGEYAGNPALAHYVQFASTIRDLGGKPEDILNFKPSPAAKASRKTFTDHYEDYILLTGVLACAESVFTLFAGPWAKSVSMSTQIDTKKGYHAIHVEDDAGQFIDDEHSEDSWFIFRQAVTPERYDDVRRKVAAWLDTWYDFGDNVMHIARTISRK